MGLFVSVSTQTSSIYEVWTFLIPRAQELELEDHQSRLEQKLREKMLKEGEYGDVLGGLVKHIFPQKDSWREPTANRRANLPFPPWSQKKAQSQAAFCPPLSAQQVPV